jgi:chemotaxis protein methyltransferase CheR
MVGMTKDDGAAADSGTEFFQLRPDEFDRFRVFIYGECGIHVPEHKVALLSNQIRRRLKATGCADFEKYYHYLAGQKGRGEVEKFIDAITTNETSFFRTGSQFDWFRAEFLPTVLAEKRRREQPRTLRVWSAACATGAEPYSIAICLYENRFRLPGWSVTVMGTDISEGALSQAREGIYKSRAVEAVTETHLRRCFRALDEDSQWQVRPEIKELVLFKRHNLMTPIREEPFDCIFLRNVLIYFDRESKKKVITHILGALAPGGYLVVGPSEGVYDMIQSLERCTPLIYQKPMEEGRE